MIDKADEADALLLAERQEVVPLHLRGRGGEREAGGKKEVGRWGGRRGVKGRQACAWGDSRKRQVRGERAYS